MLQKVVLTFDSVDEISVTTPMKAVCFFISFQKETWSFFSFREWLTWWWKNSFLPEIYCSKTKQTRFSNHLSQHLIAGAHYPSCLAITQQTLQTWKVHRQTIIKHCQFVAWNSRSIKLQVWENVQQLRIRYRIEFEINVKHWLQLLYWSQIHFCTVFRNCRLPLLPPKHV